jgi:RNA recognition motif-containing protein
LYVGNVSFQATEEQLRELFEQNGFAVENVNLVRDRFTGQSRGFAFVELANEADADKAIGALNGRDLLGRKLVVNEARPPREGGGGGGRGQGGGGGRGGYGGGGGGGRGGRGNYGGGGGRDRGERGGGRNRGDYGGGYER